VLAAKMTVNDAATLNLAGERQIKRLGRLDVEQSVKSMVALLKQYLKGEQKKRLLVLLRDPRFMQRACRPVPAKKRPAPAKKRPGAAKKRPAASSRRKT
jgi:cell division septal protein FtsQ